MSDMSPQDERHGLVVVYQVLGGRGAAEGFLILLSGDLYWQEKEREREKPPCSVLK